LKLPDNSEDLQLFIAYSLKAVPVREITGAEELKLELPAIKLDWDDGKYRDGTNLSSVFGDGDSGWPPYFDQSKLPFYRVLYKSGETGSLSEKSSVEITFSKPYKIIRIPENAQNPVVNIAVDEQSSSVDLEAFGGAGKLGSDKAREYLFRSSFDFKNYTSTLEVQSQLLPKDMPMLFSVTLKLPTATGDDAKKDIRSALEQNVAWMTQWTTGSTENTGQSSTRYLDTLSTSIINGQIDRLAGSLAEQTKNISSTALFGMVVRRNSSYYYEKSSQKDSREDIDNLAFPEEN